ncbi:hypothetical protein ANRL3_00862 [Anaerolineae bacterium]|nr:hypothetical protein ANRL3_00862 [Anaerolineae bacterium]
MPKRNGKPEVSLNAKNNGLGPVARDKYESILKSRVQQCIASQEAKIKAQRPKALKIYLDRNGLADKMTKYRAALEELIKFFGEPDWRSTVWLRDDNSLTQQSKVQSGIEAILHEMKDLKKVYAEIEHLRQFESQVTEKVWLAGTPSEIAALLEQIGEPDVAQESDS